MYAHRFNSCVWTEQPVRATFASDLRLRGQPWFFMHSYPLFCLQSPPESPKYICDILSRDSKFVRLRWSQIVGKTSIISCSFSYCHATTISQALILNILEQVLECKKTSVPPNNEVYLVYLCYVLTYCGKSQQVRIKWSSTTQLCIFHIVITMPRQEITSFFCIFAPSELFS